MISKKNDEMFYALLHVNNTVQWSEQNNITNNDLHRKAKHILPNYPCTGGKSDHESPQLQTLFKTELFPTNLLVSADHSELPELAFIKKKEEDFSFTTLNLF